MDPSMYAQYSPPNAAPNGLPQESKLATYMNRNTSTPARPLSQVFGKLSLESSPQSLKKVMINEFIPMGYYQPSIMAESPDSSPATAMAHMPNVPMPNVPMPNVPMSNVPMPNVPMPNVPMANVPMANVPMPTTSQVHQENVGGTTYFYATNSDSLNTSGLNSSASMGSDACLSSGMPPSVASPYASQIFAGNPSHLNPMNIKPVGRWHALPLASLVPVGYGAAQAACACELRPAGFASPAPLPRYSPRAEHLQPNPTPDFTDSLAASFYQPETIRQEIYHRNDDIFLRVDMMQFPELPENVEMYTNLVPLENASPHALTTAFRATHRQTGDTVALRRLHGLPAAPQRLELWKAIENPNVVRLLDYFTTQAFGDNSVVLVYSYHAGCETLMVKYLSGGSGTSNPEAASFVDPFSSDPDAPRPYTHQKNAMLRAVACGALLPEAVLWSLLVQLSGGLKALHAAGLACRCLDPTKVVINGPRVRLAWAGAIDALHPGPVDVQQAQQDDLTALGRLVVALACRTVHCDNLAACIDLVARSYSSDLKNVILYLLSSTNRRSITDLMPMIGARYYIQLEALQRRTDVFEDQLSREIDNSRLLRILIKLGVINERPELNLDSSWSETGDRYLLKLFRDRLFHGVTEDGRPWVDLAHITAALNNLDGGTDERVELISRDSQSVLVVTYGELKHCLDSAFEEVMGLSARP